MANGTSYVLGTWMTANGVNIGGISEGITGTCDAVASGELDTWYQFQTNSTNTSYLIYVQGMIDPSNTNTTSGDFRPNVE